MEKPTVLIADDDARVRQALRVRLAARGYEVVECFDGVGVLAKCHAMHLDALILDHAMPAGCGRDVARDVRACCDAPIIFLSGHDREEFRGTVQRLRDTYYLRKPADEQALFALLGSLIGVPETRPTTPAHEHCGTKTGSN